MVLTKSILALATVLAANSVAAHTIKASKGGFVGCFDAPATFLEGGSGVFMTSASCVETCSKEGNAIAATVDEGCYCGDKLPPVSMSNDDGKCDLPCPGLGAEACGSKDGRKWSFWSTGLTKEIVNESDDSAASNAANTTSASSVAPNTSASTVLGTIPEKNTVMGCYEVPLNYMTLSPSKYMTHEYCTKKCARMEYALAAIENDRCNCVLGLPDSDQKVDDSKCDVTCAGFPTEMCGSKGGEYWTLVATGEQKVVSDSEFTNTWDSGASIAVSSATRTGESNSTVTAAPSGSANPEPANETNTTTSFIGAANQGKTYQAGGLVAAIFGLVMAL